MEIHRRLRERLIVKVLLEASKVVVDFKEYKLHILLWAAKEGHLAVIKRLLQAKAQPTQQQQREAIQLSRNAFVTQALRNTLFSTSLLLRGLRGVYTCTITFFTIPSKYDLFISLIKR